MKKKILIASIFTTLLLLIPFSHIAGAQEDISYESEQYIEPAVPTNLEQLLEDIEILMNEIIEILGDYPEIVTLCYEMLELINNPQNPICNFIMPIFWAAFVMSVSE